MTLDSRREMNSDSYAEMLQAEQRIKYLGDMSLGVGLLPDDAAYFVMNNPQLAIDTEMFFDLLSNIYDKNMERHVYEDMLLLFEKAKTPLQASGLNIEKEVIN